MIDKVQKIREEVERLKEWNNNVRNSTRHMTLQEEDFNRGKHSSYLEILDFIDSLQEEPVNRTPSDVESAMQEVEEKSRVFTEAHKGEDADTILAQMRGEEPVSEDLEEAAKNHAVERYRVTRDMVLAEKCKWSFQTGAKWKEKQMMSKAVDAHVNYAWSGLSFGGFDWSKTGLDIGDKCKLIIIKED